MSNITSIFFVTNPKNMSGSTIITESLIILAATLFPIGIISLIMTLCICCKTICWITKEKNGSSKNYSDIRVDERTGESTLELIGRMDRSQIMIQMKNLDEDLSYL